MFKFKHKKSIGKFLKIETNQRLMKNRLIALQIYDIVLFKNNIFDQISI